ncbi:MAG: DMT family transporter [Boseongicola sp.]|nr:DMT family transporter [Boseongicola sp.]
MQMLGFMLAAIAVGAMITVQPPMNAIISRHVGSAFVATSISILVAFLCSLLVVAVSGVGRVAPATLAAIPWWAYLGGVVGAIFVGSGVVLAPATGALAFFVCIVAGQLVGSTIVDHYGAFGMAVREISLSRLAGVILVLAGAVLVGRG